VEELIPTSGMEESQSDWWGIDRYHEFSTDEEDEETDLRYLVKKTAISKPKQASFVFYSFLHT
jgi:hypothetical protein